ncbi:methionyl-tRNA formyltransferase [Candidatus Uhrbacteria bacterium CG_4_9_14_0_2_um_filter_41_50]|uniref:Methionyl-tRNA formyltransferase n=1 Tax=Candidatus Uhrbacteria bacterium CG_4_9_14_0_2_um_filter_41_50 TaxID=1975031 RepID=A0A2M8EQ25_9BACT|nr:MAG: methionyl-tRNA formyltransferase [Candidatus Uhrbacteria bacterium CG_4_10_14_3_um_filter_41_21]PIZ54651.1 MAG: methionyl-tRNA formyltransferase [Candidatus Uhrbacteria bacterium CG_4_10_14_0_2_um_filter_41_21]PJB84670.1 MAG: methionyl-tRNA formyltransferase [Candidatus Uhrbacteria bacterium CG_4_9_14_0_8_um_filter_41_16]PJC24801.1 MAG: methionyl-tRNA formyltransferase [Candidatus Uhrbacteria bacterium CG_4_9_14_0_2_um_filter_41_50]PJE75145.1 MAG: methionyl-tRNA formyltransferase [Candi
MIKIAFFGTPEFAKNFLARLYADAQISVCAVVCQPDKPVGRKQELEAPATKIFALENKIPVFQPANLKSDIKMPAVDLFVVVAYGKIIPQSILDIPKHGTINVHPSLLPKYRGPSPIQSAIANQDLETGVSIMLLDKEMDHGPILKQITITIDDNETPETLRAKIVDVGAPLLISSIKSFLAGDLKPTEQDHSKATICKLLTRDGGIIDWNESAEQIDAKIRAFTPWPGTSTKWDNKILKIHRASVESRPSAGPDDLGDRTGFTLRQGKVKIIDNKLFIGTASTALEILELQLEGKQKMNAKTFINGFSNINGTNLS